MKYIVQVQRSDESWAVFTSSSNKSSARFTAEAYAKAHKLRMRVVARPEPVEDEVVWDSSWF